jgi:acetyl-CoA carboxylase alpha subunit
VALKLTAQDLKKLGVIDPRSSPEPLGGAQREVPANTPRADG